MPHLPLRQVVRASDLLLLGLCTALFWPCTALAEMGYAIKKESLDTLEAQEKWETQGKNKLAQAWEDLQDIVGPIQIRLLSVAYGQLWSDTEVGGDPETGRALLGWDTRLKTQWRPWQDGEVYLQLQYNFGDKRETPAGNKVVFSDMNGIMGGLPEGKYNFHDLIFTQHLFERKFFFAFGHTDPETYLDENRFANSDHTQFSSQIFANEIGLDNVDQRAPMFAMGFEPHEVVEIVGLVSSTTLPGTPAESKNLWTRPFWDGPFIGGQVHLMPRFLDQEGNYRLFAWTTAYEQPTLKGDGKSQNWGLGFNFDQNVVEDFGIFARAGYANEDVNGVNWNWSFGAQYTGPFPTRDKDIFALAFGGVQASPGVAYGGMELHLESYYKLRLTDWFALTPMFFYTMQPKGDPEGLPIVQGMLRLELDLKS